MNSRPRTLTLRIILPRRRRGGVAGYRLERLWRKNRGRQKRGRTAAAALVRHHGRAHDAAGAVSCRSAPGSSSWNRTPRSGARRRPVWRRSRSSPSRSSSTSCIRPTEQNISDAQIKSQIAALNRDFAAKNPDRSKVPAPWQGLVTDARIQFKLHKTTRTRTAVNSFTQDDGVKTVHRRAASRRSSRQKYLNFWVCPLGGGLLGYAQFPGGPPATDGVVINYKAFGTSGTAQPPFNLGPHRDPRSRPLLQPAPHLGRHGRLQRLGHGRRHAELRGAELRASRRFRSSPATTARTATCS